MKLTSAKIGKRVLAALAVAAIGAWTPGAANAANVLFNPYLDQIGLTTQLNPCPIGWVVTASKSVSGGFTDGGDSETFCNVSPPSDPAGYGFFFKPFGGDVASEDLLTVNLYQDNASTPNTSYTLSTYASCEANFCGLSTTNSPAPEFYLYVAFMDNSGAILASNAFDLINNGLPTDGAGDMAQLTTPSFTAPANTSKVRAGLELANAYSTTGAQSCFADNFDLEATAAPGSPNITNQPAQASTTIGGNATFSVGISNPSGVTYQWQLNDQAVTGPEFSGTNSATLTITGVNTNDLGHYRVLVSNGSGSSYSSEAPLSTLGVSINPVITVDGKNGDTYEIDYTTDVANPTWIPLSTNKLTGTVLQVVDPTSALLSKRFYRAVFLH